VRRHPDSIDILGILRHVEARDDSRPPTARRRERGVRALEELAGDDLVDVLVRLVRIDGRRGGRECGGDVQDAPAGVLVEAGCVDVGRRPAHEVEQLRHVQLGPPRPHPCGRARDERRREAGAVRGRIAGSTCPRRHRNRDVLSGRGEVDGERAIREEGGTVRLVRRRDREDVTHARGRVLGIPLEEVVPCSGNEQRAGAERDVDLVREHRVVTVEPEAHVDHARAGIESVLDAYDHVADEHRAAVPLGQRRLRVDPGDTDAVLWRRDDRADSGPVRLVAARPRRLRIEERRVGPPCEFRVRHVQPGVDDRDGLACSRRRHAVGTDGAAPPLEAGQRLDRRLLQRQLSVGLDCLWAQAQADAIGDRRR
jgi:hypothetical protein